MPTAQNVPWGFDLSAMDRSVDPRNDFFRYANGKWLDETPIPDDRARWGMPEALQIKNRLRLKTILENLATGPDCSPGSETQKLRDFYATALDMEKRNHDGIEPIKNELDQIASITSIEDLTSVLARLTLIRANPIWMFDVNQDPNNSSIMSAFLMQGGLGLPDREYYLADDRAGIREQYITHVRRVFELTGEPKETTGSAARSVVLGIETELAKVSWQRSRLRDIKKQCNYFTIEGLKDLVPAINWRMYFELCGINTDKAIVVQQPGFFVKVQELLATIPVEIWKKYLKWILLNRMANHLSQDFVEETFNFFGGTLEGQQQLKPLWERAIIAIDTLMGEALGKLYIERHFGPEAKMKICELVNNIVAAFEERANALEWMNAETKEKAIGKLHAVTWKLGYPDQWRDYSNLKIRADSYARNIIAACEYDQRFWFSKVGKLTDPALWHMSPPTVDAYANPMLVEMVFPAGILQWPLFDMVADDALNYGAIGVVIGHELTHHFDDKGSAFDENGNLNNWWMPEDQTAFEKLSTELVEQSSQYELYGKHIDGKLTLGENISDLGGLAIALRAYQKSLEDKERTTLDGFTPEQRFFLSFAQIWRSKIRQEFSLQMLVIDPHAPPEFRVLGPLSNIEEFYAAFGVKEGCGMFRPAGKRVKIW